MMRERKILVIFLGTHNAGPVYAYEMTKGLIQNGATVSAIISSYAVNISAWRSLPLKRLVEIPTYRDKKEFLIETCKFFLYKRRQLKKSFSGEYFDAVYSPFFAAWNHWAIKSFSDIPLLYTVHDPILHSDESKFNRIINGFVAKDIKAADKVIVLSSIFRKYVSEYYKRRDENIIVLPHGTFETYKEVGNNQTEASEWYGEHPDSINFLFFGRIEYYKGLDLLIEAYSTLEKKYLNRVSLLIAGKGDFSSYRDAFNQLSNAKLLNYMIPDEDVMSLFHGKNVITVLPYRDATQSGVINLAAQSSSLIISTNVGGLPEQLDYGKAGILTDPTVRGLLEVMNEVTENIKGYSRIIEYGKSKVGNLTWKNLSKELLRQI
jgi:glycosyltransferase involved in cell wall biosynthesis